MKKSLLLVAIAFLCTMATISEAQRRPPLEPQVDQIIVKLEGTTPWHNTGLLLNPGDRVEFKATGHVCFSNGHPESCVGPDGYAPGHPNPPAAYENDYRSFDAVYCDDPKMDWPHASLMARDGNGMFYIGRDRVITNRRGNLEIGINDCTFTGDWYNTGSFSVVIKVVRGGR